MDQFEAVFKKIDDIHGGKTHHKVRAVDLKDCLSDYEAGGGYDQNSEFKYINNFVSECGFRAPTGWTVLTERQASLLLQKVLLDDLAHQGDDPRKIYRPNPEAENVTKELFGLFDLDEVLFVTTDLLSYRSLKIGEYGGSQDGIAGSTFESGIIIYDTQNIALVWVEAED